MATLTRLFTSDDRKSLSELFVRAGEDSPVGELWGHPESERAVYLDPYMDLEPDSLFVAEVDGRLVGYLTGCLDSSRFPGEDERMSRAIRDHRLMIRPRVMKFFARSLVDMARAKLRGEQMAAGQSVDQHWPSHLHINMAPEARGTGAADALMEQWRIRLLENGSTGCHLQTLTENTRAVRFFERCGFRSSGPTPLVPGIRYEGQRLHQLTMVWEPPEQT